MVKNSGARMKWPGFECGSAHNNRTQEDTSLWIPVPSCAKLGLKVTAVKCINAWKV